VSTSYFQIGSDRFAIHMWHESLPPAPRRPILEPRIKKKTGAVLLLRGPASAEPGSNSAEPSGLVAGNVRPSRRTSPIKKLQPIL
jgi:hypothetical protein